MKSKIAIGFFVAACCFASCLAAGCTPEPNASAESYVCQNLGDMSQISGTVPTTAQRITIYDSKITSLPARAFFNWAATLVYLNISNSEVEDIQPGAFAGLGGLQTLVLNNNHITLLKTDWLKDLANLRYLYVYDNNITAIEPEVFDYLQNLQVLDVANNKIDYCFSEESLSKLTQLKTLYITANPWPQRCQPSVFFYLLPRHVTIISTWRDTYIFIAECLAHEPYAQYNDDILSRCVEKLITSSKASLADAAAAKP